jgi:hypothetical protein
MGKGITKKQGSTDQLQVWVKSILPSQITDVQVKLRGRQLHIICEALHCPSMAEIAEHFTQAFHPDFLVDHLGAEYHADLQIFLCGRAKGHRRPDWTLKLDTQGQSNFRLPHLKQSSLPSSLLPGDRPVLAGLPASSEELSELGTPPIEEPVVLQAIQNELSAQIKLPLFNDLEQSNHQVSISQPINTDVKNHDSLSHGNELGDELIVNLNHHNINANIASPIHDNLTNNLNDHSNHDFSTTNHAIVAVTETSAIEEINPDHAIRINDEQNSSSDIIATTLNEILAGLGVTVQVSIVPIIKASKVSQPEKNTDGLNISPQISQNLSQSVISANTKKRLIIQCEASYNPDPSLLAEPIAQKLRELNLKDCRDALITMQVRGETTPDWSLKIDLTPPDLLLREWARWGDVIAIERILQKQLAILGIEIRATLKESTLHLFCSNTPNSDSNYQQKTLQAIAKILQKVSPQGVQAVTIYGCTYHDLQQTNQPASPLWVDWLDLKQPDKPDLQLTAKQLAENGNQNALGFLLNRLLNPDLDRKLQTGGVRVLLLIKNHILHIMTEAPTCPSQSQVAPPIVNFLQQCNLADVSYVRIYGRRAGQKQVIWRAGFAYDPNVTRENLSEFNISPQELLSLSSQPMSDTSSSLVLTGATNISDFTNTETSESGLNQTFRRLLLNTGLCSPHDQEITPQYRPWVTILAIATGLFFTFSLDQLGGILLADGGKNQEPVCTEIDCPWEDTENDGSNHLLNTLTTNNGEKQQFTASKFTDSNTNISELLSQLYPSFRSPQLDEQLLRYQKYLLEHKRPPDILIVGSSRALRGIDPQVLESNLKQAGHGDLRVFNLGINGATMQVVDLIVRRVLTPAQLPKLIIMADGVRALNSGRADLTYDIIASSEGYQQAITNNHLLTDQADQAVADSDLVAHTENIAQIKDSQSTTNNLVSMIQAKLVNMSALYPHRETVKQKLLTTINTPPENLPEISAQANASDSVNNQGNTAIDNFENLNDFTNQGFLPISAKFEPIQYYQSHPQVSGYYDRDYESFQLLGKQTDALKNLLEYTAKKDINILFVNMPLTYEYLDQVRTAYEKEFIAYMQQLSSQYQHLTFQNLGASLLQDYDKFSDPSHLNKFGAIAVAENLATTPDISWRKLVTGKSLGNR